MLYEKVIDYCDKNNISVSDLETRCDFGNGTIGKWKKYNPRIETLQKLAKETNKPIEYWLEGM